jgi:hypothetical protein
MADVVKTIGASGADFTTLAAWWSARNTFAGAGDVYIAELIDAADYAWGEVTGTFDGSVKVRAATAVKLDLTNPTAPHAKIASTTTSALYWRPVAPMTLEDLELVTTAASVCLRVGAFEDTNTTVMRCLVRGGTTGISHGRATATTLVENCVVTGATTWGINNGFAGITVRKCVVVGNNTTNTASRGGMRKDISGAVIDNVVCYGNGLINFFGASTTSTVSYLSSGDTSATGANALTGVTTAAFTNYAGQVYTAAAGGVLDNSAAGGADRGLNLSVADIIAITSPYDWQMFQRNAGTNTGSIAITGTYSGGTVPTGIEARWNGGAWTTITASPSGGTFSGTLTGLPSGNGTLEVRYSNATSVTDSADNIAIGAKFLFWGQSNFSGRANNPQAYTGTAGFFHKYTVTNNLWQQGADPFDTDTASGSLFPLLANSLTAYLGCPVAFIGVAAGSTTLSQWQSGQTLNTRMLNYITAAASDGLEGVCSWIGESDAGAATSETDFKTRYNAVIDQLKTLTGKNSMLVAISGLNLTDYANVRQWINDIAASNANASDVVPQIWPLYQKIHYETDTEAQLAATAVYNGMVSSFYSSPFDSPLTKSNLSVSQKTLNLSVGWDSPIVKTGVMSSGKTLTLDSGTSVSFDSGLNRGSISVAGKSSSFSGGFDIGASKLSVNLSGKQLTLSTGTAVGFDADVIKYSVNVVSKLLTLDSGTATPFDGTLIKRNIITSGKTLSISTGSSLNMGLTTYTFGYKTLGMAQSVFYPVDISRVYFIDGNKVKTFFIK